MQKRVLVLCFTEHSRDPRVLRQLRALAGQCQLTVAGLDNAALPGVAHVRLLGMGHVPLWRRGLQILRAPRRRHEVFYWSQAHIRKAYAALKEGGFDCIIANDPEALPLAVRLAREQGARLVYDAHEFAPDQMGQSLYWRLLRKPYKTWICRTFMKQADQCITVNAPIAEAYKAFGVSCEVCMNLPEHHSLPVRQVGQVVRLVHHGMAFPDRELELMVEVATQLDARFETSFVLVPGQRDYIERLKAMAAGNARIHFPPPVGFEGIVPMLHQFDVGLYLLKPHNFNHRYALPNKLFEFIQARLALAISPSPAMAQVVREHGCGVVATDFTPQALAAAINALSTEQINAFKAASHAAAEKLHSGAMTENWRRWAGL